MSETATEQKPAAVPCDCWEQTNIKLREKGFQLSGKLSALQFSLIGECPVIRLLPIEKADGTKLKRSDPQTVFMTHCPFCGVNLVSKTEP